MGKRREHSILKKKMKVQGEDDPVVKQDEGEEERRREERERERGKENGHNDNDSKFCFQNMRRTGAVLNVRENFSLEVTFVVRAKWAVCLKNVVPPPAYRQRAHLLILFPFSF